MSDPSSIRKPLRVASIVPSLTAGGIGPVCQYAAEGVAKLTDWQVTLLSLHDAAGEFTDEASGLRILSLGLGENCAQLFLQWLAANPQDILITSSVCHIEPAYPFLPFSTRHVMQIHDSGRRYLAVPVRHAEWIDGVTCVARHMEELSRRRLHRVGFRGLLRTVHNGANFPPPPNRGEWDGPLRLLFMGRVDALKGVFDFVSLLERLRKSNVPVTLNLVGGDNVTLRRHFSRKGLDSMVNWSGRVPHKQCYDIAAVSDIFLMASRKEPFGMVTIEAMSMGCVPIAYDIPSGSTEIIEHGKNGLLVPLGDIRTIAEHICQLHRDRTLLGRLSSGAIERARGAFNAEVMARNMVSFLNDVLAHAENCPAQRQSGSPPRHTIAKPKGSRGYQRLPEGLREWIRNTIGARPKLSHWLLNR